ncbi:hypothetical protein [Acetobacter fallax]|uniref:ABC transporter permease n=1 Tax=Acetobacter fallax TaxID=1737473 RepID=A0ABX0K9W4_9PROT|nr:hypothetical protein [Acetobacter fallax]NHO31766.1 hypothetical protein [Acetobacter fallax]NHO35325.1 hypothetical protein [Acetobacter fallax]
MPVLSRRDWRDLRRTFGQYGTSAFWRGNPVILTAGVFVALAVLKAFRLHGQFPLRSLPELMKGNPFFSFLYAAFFIPAGLQFYAGNQISAAQAPGIPGLVRSEARVAALLACLTVLCLGALMAVSGLPFHDTLFFILVYTIPSLPGWYSPARTGSRRKRAVTILAGILLILTFTVASFLSDLQLWLVTRPPVVTVPGSILLMGMLIAAVLSLPNRIWHQPLVSEERKTVPGAAVSGPSRPRLSSRKPGRYELRQMLLAPGLPVSLRNDILLSISAIPVCVTLLACLPFGHGAFADKWLQTAQGMTIMIAGGNTWLMERRHWPMLLMTGRFGARLQFVRAVFKAALTRSALTVSLRTLSLVVPYAILSRSSSGHAAVAAVELAACVTGLAFVPALPFFVMREPAKGVIAGASMATIFGVQIFNPFTIGVTKAGIVTVLSVLVGVICYVRAPRPISRADWPFGSEPS